MIWSVVRKGRLPWVSYRGSIWGLVSFREVFLGPGTFGGGDVEGFPCLWLERLRRKAGYFFFCDGKRRWGEFGLTAPDVQMI